MARITRGQFILMVGLILACLHTALWAAPKLLSGSITPNGPQTQIVLDASDELNYRYFTLTQPNRLVVDMTGVLQNDALLGLNKKVHPDDHFISQVRLGQQNEHTVRVVFDLKRPAQVYIDKEKNRLKIKMVETKQEKSNIKNQSFSLFGVPSKKSPVIVIDPGHGGKDSGAQSETLKLQEKNIVLQFAKETQKKLAKKGYQVHLTRNKDNYIKLNERRAIADKLKADVFISLHADKSPHNTEARGSAVYIWSLTEPDQEARLLAEAENRAYGDVSGGSDADNKTARIVYNYMQYEQVSHDSARLGNAILRRIGKENKLLSPQLKPAPFSVLRSLKTPSVLVELAFLSNLEDEKLLQNKDFRDNISSAIADGVDAYFRDPKTVLQH